MHPSSTVDGRTLKVAILLQIVITINSETFAFNFQISPITVTIESGGGMERVAETTKALPLTRNETRRSKSKVRSYLRRCKEVITGHHQEITDHHRLSSIASSHELVIQHPIQSQPHFNIPLDVIVHQKDQAQSATEEDLAITQAAPSDGVPAIVCKLDVGSEVRHLTFELTRGYRGKEFRFAGVKSPPEGNSHLVLIIILANNIVTITCTGPNMYVGYRDFYLVYC